MPLNLRDLLKSTPGEDRAAVPVLLEGSPEQTAIWDYFRTGTTHAVIAAVAGSGKTTTLIQGVMRMRDLRPLPNTLFLAFNRHIAAELSAKLQSAGVAFARAYTCNAFGNRIVHRAYPRARLDEHKLKDIVDPRVLRLEGRPLPFMSGAVAKLIRQCKNHLADGKDKTLLLELGERFNVAYTNRYFRVIPDILDECRETAETVIDYDDQIWLPVVLDLPVDKFDLLLGDEVQDWSPVQQELVMRASGAGRVVLAGDERQSIYSWRGADAYSIPNMRRRLARTERGVTEFPLTLTRRCPKSHVRMAQAIVPQIHAMPDAPEGKVELLPEEKLTQTVAPGDLVLCRTNAPLIHPCYSMIRAGIKAIIRGRDVAEGILAWVNKLAKSDSIEDLVEAVKDYRVLELGKLRRLGDRAESRIEALGDKCDCFFALSDGVRTVPELRQKIDRIFSEFDDAGRPKDAVVLGTIHRTKGLESTRVFVLSPELLPHPMAKSAPDRLGEENLAYVAVTRAKYDLTKEEEGRLVFVQNAKSCGIPPIFGERKPPVREEFGQQEEDDMERARR